MQYRNNSNFKLAPYYAWVDAGGKAVKPYDGLRKLRSFAIILDCMVGFMEIVKQHQWYKLYLVERENYPADINLLYPI